MPNPFTLNLACHRWPTLLIAVLAAALGSLPIAAAASAGFSPAADDRQAAAPSEDAQRPVTDEERAVRLRLPPLNATESAWVADPASIPSPARLGFGRAIPDAGFTAALSDPDHWRPTADGRRQLRLAITSPGALGLRSMPCPRVRNCGCIPHRRRTSSRSAALRSPPAWRAIARHWRPLATVPTRRPCSGPRSCSVRPSPWSSACRLAASRKRSLSAWITSRICPGCRSPRLANARKERTSASAISPATMTRWPRAWACATAILLYALPDGASNACSGVLLADGDPETRVPYLITAHHCVPDQARASSLETFWEYQAHGCGQGLRQAPARVSGGAELLDAHQSLDTAPRQDRPRVPIVTALKRPSNRCFDRSRATVGLDIDT